jgi:hypothetical protein
MQPAEEGLDASLVYEIFNIVSVCYVPRVWDVWPEQEAILHAGMHCQQAGAQLPCCFVPAVC